MKFIILLIAAFLFIGCEAEANDKYPYYVTSIETRQRVESRNTVPQGPETVYRWIEWTVTYENSVSFNSDIVITTSKEPSVKLGDRLGIH